MKYITKEILYSYDNEEPEAEDNINSAFKLYLKEKVPALKQLKYANRYLNLLDFHFHDCQVINLFYDKIGAKVSFEFDGGLKPYSKYEKCDKLDINRIEFFNAYIISDIKIPFSFNSAKNNYIYIYANEFDFDEQTLYSKFSFISNNRDEVQIFFNSFKVL